MIPKEYLRPGQCEKNVLNFTRSTGGKKRGDLSVDENDKQCKEIDQGGIWLANRK